MKYTIETVYELRKLTDEELILMNKKPVEVDVAKKGDVIVTPFGVFLVL